MSTVFYESKEDKDSQTITTAAVEPKRDKDSTFTNNYSLMLLLNWRANCDMRLISKSLLSYNF